MALVLTVAGQAGPFKLLTAPISTAGLAVLSVTWTIAVACVTANRNQKCSCLAADHDNWKLFKILAAPGKGPSAVVLSGH